MAIDALPLVKRIADFFCNEHPDRPWPNDRVHVTHVLHKNSTLLAVVYKEIDAKLLDNTSEELGAVTRVVFTLTVLDLGRKKVHRMVEYLCNYIPYSGDVMGRNLGAAHTATVGERRRVTGYDPSKLPEEQALVIQAPVRIGATARRYEADIQMCYNDCLLYTSPSPRD